MSGDDTRERAKECLRQAFRICFVAGCCPDEVADVIAAEVTKGIEEEAELMLGIRIRERSS